MNFQKERSDYYLLPLSEKRVTTLALLKGLEGKAEVFDTLYQHILNNPQNLIETELDEVYESIMSVLIEDSDEKLQVSLDRLNEVSIKLEQMREKERRERETEDVGNMFAMI